MTLRSRLRNPAALLPEVGKPIGALVQATHEGGVPDATLEVHLRVSQINGCGWCVEYGVRSAKWAGEDDLHVTTRQIAGTGW
jgi:AhpD family alkylhydroperoxidase